MALVPLQTDRLRLRALDLSDLDGVFAILGHKSTTAGVSWGLDTLDEAAEWLGRRCTNERELGYSMWAVELCIQSEFESEHGRRDLIGLCGFFPTEETDRVELGYVIHADHWGKGFGTEAAQVSINAATTNGLNVIATIRTTNQASIKVAQRIGLLQTDEHQDDRGTLLVWTRAAAETTSLDTAASDAEDELLGGGWQTQVHRRGKTVLRTVGPQSQTVIRLLHHLADKGFDAAPVPIGTGFADDGREHLSFIGGRVLNLSLGVTKRLGVLATCLGKCIQLRPTSIQDRRVCGLHGSVVPYPEHDPLSGMATSGHGTSSPGKAYRSRSLIGTMLARSMQFGNWRR